MWFELRRDTPRHHVTLRWRADGREHDASICSLAMTSYRGDVAAKQQRRAPGLGRETGATMAHFVPVWQRLLVSPAAAPNRSARIHCEGDCASLEKLEIFTATVVQWQLRHLTSAAE